MNNDAYIVKTGIVCNNMSIVAKGESHKNYLPAFTDPTKSTETSTIPDAAWIIILNCVSKSTETQI